MDIAAEKQVVMKYCIRRSKTGIETISELKEAYGDECLAKSTVLKWHATFVKGLSEVLPKFEKMIKVKWQERLERCIEGTISKNTVVKKLKLMLVILKKGQNKEFCLRCFAWGL